MKRMELLVIIMLGAVLPLALVGCGGIDSPGAGSQASPQDAGALQADAQGNVKVIIGFEAPPGPAQQKHVRGLGGKIKCTYTLIPAIAATIPAQAVDALQKNPNVDYVEADGQLKASVEVVPYGVERIGAPAAHATTLGAGVDVAIIDTGIDDGHEDLQGRCAGGYDFVNSDSDPMDDNGHGTHCAGIVAAVDNEIGVIGVAPQATLHALKVLDASGAGWDSDLILALQWCVDNAIEIASISMGSPLPSSALEDACNSAYSADILLVAAAGNGGRPSGRGDRVEYPAKYESVIAVGATDWSNNRTSWSATGPALELAAPGNNIYSTYLMGLGDPVNYATMSGTSMACPHVSGTAALVFASGAASTAAGARDLLRTTADDLGATGWDPLYGYGLVDADEAVGVTPNTPPSVTITAPPDGSTFADGEVITFTGSATDDEDGDLSEKLAWTSSIDEAIGSGSSCIPVLSTGTHLITASVTDSGGLTGTDTIQVTVGTTPPPPALSVVVTTDKPSYSSGETAYITVSVTAGGTAVAGASLEVVITTPRGRRYVKTGATDLAGVVTFTHNLFTRRDGSGTYSVVGTASKAGFADGSGAVTFEGY